MQNKDRVEHTRTYILGKDSTLYNVEKDTQL